MSVQDTSKDADPSLDDLDDAALIRKAEELNESQQLIQAAKLLRRVQDESLLTDKHRKMMKWASKIEESIVDIVDSPEDDEMNSAGWTKQAESHGFRDFFVYYKVNEKTQLTSRIDCAVESSLLVPILSVFNESELYTTWMPSYKRPIKLGVQETKKLAEYGRGNQIIQVVVGMGWPWKTRESVQHAWAVDMIDESGAIAIQVLGQGPEDDPMIPPAKKGVVRIDFDCTILIRACPPDHPCLRNSKHKFPQDEPLVLFGLKQSVDAHVTGIPIRAVNYVSRTVIGRMWSNMLQVATDIKEGKRPQHAEAIAAKSDLYDWVKGRIKVMVDKLKEGEKSKGEETKVEIE